APRARSGPALALALPRDGAMVPGGSLEIAGTLLGGGGLSRVAVAVNDGPPQPLDLGPACPGPGRTVSGRVDVRAEGCRLALRVVGETAWGERVDLGGTLAWQPRHVPAAPRILPVVVDAAIHGADDGRRVLRGRIVAPGHPRELEGVILEAWQAGVGAPVPLDAEGGFEAGLTGPAHAGVHLWARFPDHRRRDAHLCGLWPAPGDGPPAADEDGTEIDAWISAVGTEVALSGPGAPAPGARNIILNGRPAEAVTPALETQDFGTQDLGTQDPGAARPWRGRLPAEVDLLAIEDGDGLGAARSLAPRRAAPGEALRRARRAGRMLRLEHAAGAAETVHPLRLQPVAGEWALVVRRGLAVEDLPLGDVTRIEPADTSWSGLADRAAGRALKEHGQGLRPPARPLAGDLPPPSVLPVPACDLRPPPAVIDRVVLVRPGAFPTDDLYVLHPVPPVLRELGLELEVVTIGDGPEAPPPLSADTVVIVSRQASPAWIDRLARSPAFVIYLIDDDIAAAADSPGMSHDFRRRMMELLHSDVAPLLRRCDRLLITAPGLLARYASPKTEVMAPPFVRPPRTLDHLREPGIVRLTYQGTESHHEDIEFLFPSLGRILERHPHVHCSLFGRRTLPAPLRGHPRVEVMKPLPWSDYVAFVAATPAHIALAPMLDTPFNRGKSILKVLDAASLGAAGVFSRVMPFDTLVRDGVDGLLVDNDPACWEQALDDLVTAPGRIAALAEAGLARARRLGALEAASAVWRRLLGHAAPAASVDNAGAACDMDPD
ncbi:glycosyltransferase, partial [Xanthobacter sp. V4C-4]|uniref:glycosyltransferase n=1 Tax=Xanthobacter cornucopiae TaxID=3119924 RepID=UPI003728DC34